MGREVAVFPLLRSVRSSLRENWDRDTWEFYNKFGTLVCDKQNSLTASLFDQNRGSSLHELTDPCLIMSICSGFGEIALHMKVPGGGDGER